jgi:hypothetical protein
LDFDCRERSERESGGVRVSSFWLRPKTTILPVNGLALGGLLDWLDSGLF